MTDNMPTTYETKTTTQSSSSIGLHKEYIRTIPGILKIVEIVLCLLVIICASIHLGFVHYGGGGWVQFVSIMALLCTLFLFVAYLTGLINKLPGPWVLIILSILTFICSCVSFYPGQGWVQFVAISAFVTTLIYFILHLLNLLSHFPGPYLLIEFIYYCVFTLFYLIAAIVAASRGSWHPSVGAAAFFAFSATAVYAVDTFFQFRAYRTGQTEMTTTTTTTTSSSANVEAARQGPY